MNVYIYCADIYCEQCGIRIMADCIASGEYPGDIDDETSYDSDVFPKGPFENGGGEADCPQHCGSGEYCENAYTPKGWNRKVGMFLENDLTSDGVGYVVESFLDDRSNPVCIEWIKYYYSTCGYDLEREYNDVTVRLS